MEQSWGMDIIRSFFAVLDRAIFGLMSVIYRIILLLADTTVIKASSIDDLYTRIYAILGIFMLFKVTFSFVNYVINPDSFTDKQKGAGNLIKNSIIVLVMIIITPFAFDKLYEVQSAILTDNLIPKFFFGSNSTMGDTNNIAGNTTFKMYENCLAETYAADDGTYLSLMTFKPFYQPYETLSENPNLSGSAASKYDKYYCPNGKTVTVGSYLQAVNIYKGGSYIIDYRFFLSTIVGIVVVLILISFCFDVAIRSVKLAFLQILAPIPIISYVDPNASKNGMFSKWLKEVGSTWVSLFIRFIALFFAIFIIAELDVNIPGSDLKFWVMMFLIIGVLMFAKQMPKLLEQLIPGLKMSGSFNLNPFKRIASDAIGGKQLLGAAAAGLGLGAASVSNLGYHIKDKLDERKDQKELNAAKNRWRSYNDSIDRRHASGDISDAQWMKFGANADKKYDAAIKTYNDKLSERMEKFSFRHPILSNITQTFTGAKMGYAVGKSGKMPNVIEIGQKSAKVRDYKDNYSIKDRVTDKATDFFGVKNDSGTTSIVAGDIKKNEELLTRINRNIEMMNRQLSDLGSTMGPSEFAKAVTAGADGRYQLNPSYSGTYLSDIKSVLDNMNSLENQRLATTKEIKRLQKIKDKTPGGPKK